jgi:hypothetical protein
VMIAMIVVIVVIVVVGTMALSLCYAGCHR